MADLWYYTTEGRQREAVTTAELKRLARDGTLRPTDMVWKDGMPRWVRASTVKELYPDPLAALDQKLSDETQPMPALEARVMPAAAVPAAAKAKANPERAAHAEDEPAGKESRKRRDDRWDDEDDDRPKKRRSSRKREGSNFGIIIGVIVGGAVLVLLLLVGVLIVVFQSARAAIAHPMRGAGVNRVINGAAQDGPVDGKVVNYVVDLREDEQDSRLFTLRQGVAYEFTVRGEQGSDVDLFILDGDIEQAADENLTPHSRILWTAPVTKAYLIELDNLGPGSNRCHVTIKELAPVRPAAPPPAAPPAAPPGGPRVQPLIPQPEVPPPLVPQPIPPAPQGPTLPGGVKTGHGMVRIDSLAAGAEHVFKLQLEKGRPALINALTFGGRPNADGISLTLLRDADDTEVAAGERFGPAMRVRHTPAATEVFRVRVHNAGNAAVRCTVTY